MSKRKVFQISSPLTEALEETAQAAENYSGQLRVEILPLKKIEVDPENPRELAVEFLDILNGCNKDDPLYDRKIEEIACLEPMAESIKRDGIINPVLVYEYGDKYRLVAGERRALASVLAGQEYIQAKILDKKPVELQLRLLQWVENVERENLSLWERLRNLEKIVEASNKEEEAKKVTPTYIKQLIGCALSHAMNYCYVLNADSPLKEAIKNNKIKNLEKAALIAQIDLPQLRCRVMEECINGATMLHMRHIVAESKKERSLKQARLGRRVTQVNFGCTKKNFSGEIFY